MTHTPRKRFGQNFLVDTKIIGAIVAAIDPQPKQHFLEIGPGQGALTAGLVASGATIDAVEIDRDLAQYLSERYSNASNFNLHVADVLKFSIHDVQLQTPDQKLRVVGNLPYNISTPLMFKLFTEINHIQDMVFMLQHEVGLRLSAQPGSKAYGRLSVMAQYYCDMQIVLDVPPSAFEPAPKVDSCIVHFTPHLTPRIVVADLDLLHNVVTQAFSQRRKTISNSLKPFISAQALQELNIDPKLRAENLSLEDFATIVTYIIQGN